MAMEKKKHILTMALVIAFTLGFVVSVRAAELAEGDQQAGADRIVADGVYKVALAADKRYVWDISDASDLDRANLQLWTDNDSDAQKFIFTYHSDGYYTITNLKSGKVIECANGSSKDGANIQQHSGNNTDAQLWKLTCVERGNYTLTCKCNGKVADVQGGTVKRGTNIQMYHLNQTAAQEFKLVEVVENTSENPKGLHHIAACLIFAVELVAIVGAGCFFQCFQRKRDYKE